VAGLSRTGPGRSFSPGPVPRKRGRPGPRARRGPRPHGMEARPVATR